MSFISTIQLLILGRNILWYLASCCLASTLFLYTTYGQHHHRISILSNIIPTAAALSGIALAYFSNTATNICVLLLLFFGISYIKEQKIFAQHALCVCFISFLMYQVDWKLSCVLEEFCASQTRTFEGILLDKDTWGQRKNGTVLTFLVASIDHVPISGKLFLYTYYEPRIEVGDVATLYNIKITPPTKDRPSHLKNYAIREQTIGSVCVPSISYRKRADHLFKSRWLRWWHHKRKALYLLCKESLPEKTFTLMSALFFGNKNRSDFYETRRLFTAWGITHYLARSGLHVVLILSMLNFLLGFIPISLNIKLLLLLSWMSIYHLLSWGSVSFMRALLLWVLSTIATLAMRPIQPLYLLNLLTLTLLLYNPAHAACLDFQLSFFLTAVLMYISYARKFFFVSDSLR